MRDFLGNELAIGDIVVYASNYRRNLKEGLVYKLTDKTVFIRDVDKATNTIKQGPEQVVKLKESGILKFRRWQMYFYISGNSGDTRPIFDPVYFDASLNFDDVLELCREPYKLNNNGPQGPAFVELVN